VADKLHSLRVLREQRAWIGDVLSTTSSGSKGGQGRQNGVLEPKRVTLPGDVASRSRVPSVCDPVFSRAWACDGTFDPFSDERPGRGAKSDGFPE
jgi:hypothetical protein